MYRDKEILVWELLPSMGKMDWELSSFWLRIGLGRRPEEEDGEIQGWCLGNCKRWWHLQSQLGCTDPGFHQDMIIPYTDKNMRSKQHH